MLNFLMANWQNLLVIVFFVAIILWLIKHGSTKAAKRMLLYLVTQAETQYGNGAGELQYSAVVSWLYERLPTIFKLFLTTKQLDKLIGSAVVYMKEYLREKEKVLIENQ